MKFCELLQHSSSPESWYFVLYALTFAGFSTCPQGNSHPLNEEPETPTYPAGPCSFLQDVCMWLQLAVASWTLMLLQLEPFLTPHQFPLALYFRAPQRYSVELFEDAAQDHWPEGHPHLREREGCLDTLLQAGPKTIQAHAERWHRSVCKADRVLSSMNTCRRDTSPHRQRTLDVFGIYLPWQQSVPDSDQRGCSLEWWSLSCTFPHALQWSEVYCAGKQGYRSCTWGNCWNSVRWTPHTCESTARETEKHLFHLYNLVMIYKAIISRKTWFITQEVCNYDWYRYHK